MHGGAPDDCAPQEGLRVLCPRIVGRVHITEAGRGELLPSKRHGDFILISLLLKTEVVWDDFKPREQLLWVCARWPTYYRCITPCKAGDVPGVPRHRGGGQFGGWRCDDPPHRGDESIEGHLQQQDRLAQKTALGHGQGD